MAAHPGARKRSARLWTEEELVLLLWALPLVTAIAEMSGREFSAIAMKLANLLAAETKGRQGLANFSALDKALVERYRNDRLGLERRVLDVLRTGRPESDRSAEIREGAIDIVKTHQAPLHVDLIAAMLASRDLTLIAGTETIRKALSDHAEIHQVADGVFVWRSTK